MRRTTAASKLLRELTEERYWTAATLAERAGIPTPLAKELLGGFEAGGLVQSKPHDATRLTYRLALAAAARKGGDGTAPGEAPQSGGDSRNAQKPSSPRKSNV